MWENAENYSKAFKVYVSNDQACWDKPEMCIRDRCMATKRGTRMSFDADLSEFTAFDSDTDHPHDECGVFGVDVYKRQVSRSSHVSSR